MGSKGIANRQASRITKPAILIEFVDPDRYGLKYFREVISYRLEDIVLPITQRINARTLGEQLVSVQPLAMPTGLLYYMDFQHGQNREQNNFNRVSRFRQIWKKFLTISRAYIKIIR